MSNKEKIAAELRRLDVFELDEINSILKNKFFSSRNYTESFFIGGLEQTRRDKIRVLLSNYRLEDIEALIEKDSKRINTFTSTVSKPLVLIIASLTLTIITLSQPFLFNLLFEKDIKKREIAAEQIKLLSDVSDNLKDLQNFIESQKATVEERERIINELEQEKKNLEPVVKANKDLIEKIFTIQESRQKSQVWWDRLWGFLLGILSSLIATIIWLNGKGRLGYK